MNYNRENPGTRDMTSYRSHHDNPGESLRSGLGGQVRMQRKGPVLVWALGHGDNAGWLSAFAGCEPKVSAQTLSIGAYCYRSRCSGKPGTFLAKGPQAQENHGIGVSSVPRGKPSLIALSNI